MNQGKHGYFITFEGPDGCGKSTQVPLLAEELEDLGLAVLVLREPGGTDIGEQIREVLHRVGNTEMDARTEVLLFSASRAQLVAQMILPALEEGKIVLCDRFYDSTLAYQVGGRGLPRQDITWLNNFAAQGLVPDLTLLIDIDAETGLSRRRQGQGEWNRLDQECLAFHEKVRGAYDQMLAVDKTGRWVRIDGGKGVTEVADDIASVVLLRLTEAGYLEGPRRIERS